MMLEGIHEFSIMMRKKTNSKIKDQNHGRILSNTKTQLTNN